VKYSLRYSLTIILAFTQSSCHPATGIPVAATSQNDHPNDRIVSLDYCADQMLLGLVDKSRIAAVSVDVTSDPLFAEPLSKGLPRVRPDIERVMALRPTLVIRSYGGGPRIEAALRRAQIPVFALPYADDPATIRHAITASGEALNAQPAAARRLAEFDAAFAIATQHSPSLKALYVTPGDVTTGPDSLVARLMAAAGFTSYEARPGWHRLPLEQLVGEQPDLVVRGFYDSPAHRQDHWSSSSHHALRATLATVPQVTVPGSEIACGNWLAGNALRRLVQARRGIGQ